MIEVRNLTKRYGDHLAVKDLTFTIDKGRIYGFLGPNGAGKSTTLNMISGYLAATGGTVLIDGKDILKEPEQAKRSIGYLPDMPPVYNDMTVREYLVFVSELKGIPKDGRSLQIDIIMRRMKLEDVSSKLIGNLSKGYRQRVGLAQALIGFPETVILDEPMTGLDPEQIIEIRELIRGLARHHTVILSSHILAEVRELCDCIIMISGGEIVAFDSPENLEKMFDSETRIVLEAKGDEDVIRDIAACAAGSGDVKIIGGRGADGDIHDIISAPGADVYENIDAGSTVSLREKLFFAFSEAGLPLLSMTEQHSTLEQVYLRLTQGGGATDEGDL